MKSSYGWILRVYASKKDDVSKRIIRVENIVQKIRKVSDGPILVLVPYDKDCGGTRKDASIMFNKHPGVIVSSPEGSPCTKVLNSGLKQLRALGCSHAVVISNKTVSAVTSKTMAAIEKAVSDGAKVIGVMPSGLSKSTLLPGAVQNTFAVWETESAVKLGGFRFEHPEKGGVEEISLQLRMIHKFGKCVALIESPQVEFDVHDTAEAQQRFNELAQSKLERQEFLVRREGYPLDIFSEAVMIGYPVTI